MTCSHCANAVSQALRNLPGVIDATVDLHTGAVTITSDANLSLDGVEAAITDVGYQLIAFEQLCPRCGDQITGLVKERVADAVIDHASRAHNHHLDRDVILAHLEGIHPHDREG